MVDQMVEGEFEGAGLDLFGEHDRDKMTLSIRIRFIFCHSNPLC